MQTGSSSSSCAAVDEEAGAASEVQQSEQGMSQLPRLERARTAAHEAAGSSAGQPPTPHQVATKHAAASSSRPHLHVQQAAVAGAVQHLVQAVLLAAGLPALHRLERHVLGVEGVGAGQVGCREEREGTFGRRRRRRAATCWRTDLTPPPAAPGPPASPRECASSRMSRPASTEAAARGSTLLRPWRRAACAVRRASDPPSRCTLLSTCACMLPAALAAVGGLGTAGSGPGARRGTLHCLVLAPDCCSSPGRPTQPGVRGASAMSRLASSTLASGQRVCAPVQHAHFNTSALLLRSAGLQRRQRAEGDQPE